MRRDDQRLNDILEALDWISRAVARLSFEVKARDASMPWQDIVGLRNVLVHEYFGIHWPLVWQTAVDQVPVLRAQIAAIRKEQ